jgi:hypothetical protein
MDPIQNAISLAVAFRNHPCGSALVALVAEVESLRRRLAVRDAALNKFVKWGSESDAQIARDALKDDA